MKSCFIFGHGICSEDILPQLEQTIEKYVLEANIGIFYVGNRGDFDRLAAAAVKTVKNRIPDIQLHLLLAYHPAERPVVLSEGFDNSFYPPLENVPRVYSIVRANRYMVDAADAIICYVKHPGNARNLLEYAQRRQKKQAFPIDNLATQ